jgi:membrane-associated phospholipid phosphatase
MKNLITFIRKWVPLESIFPFVLIFGYQCFSYFLTQQIVKNRQLHDLTTAFDQAVPFIPEFIYIYFLSYVFWIVIELIVCSVSMEHFYRVITISLIGNTLAVITFIIMPTTIERPEVVVTGFTTWLVQFMYQADKPLNLFPSIHCFVSWLCFKAVYRQKVFTKQFRFLVFVIAVLICISTQVLKQHYILDLITGILLAEILWFISGKWHFYKPLMQFFRWIYRIFRDKMGISYH